MAVVLARQFSPIQPQGYIPAEPPLGPELEHPAEERGRQLRPAHCRGRSGMASSLARAPCSVGPPHSSHVGAPAVCPQGTAEPFRFGVPPASGLAAADNERLFSTCSPEPEGIDDSNTP